MNEYKYTDEQLRVALICATWGAGPHCGDPDCNHSELLALAYRALQAALAEKGAEVERLKRSNADSCLVVAEKQIANLQSRLALQAEVIEAAKKARAGGPYTPMFAALDALASIEARTGVDLDVALLKAVTPTAKLGGA